jgi:hypothetical protein
VVGTVVVDTAVVVGAACVVLVVVAVGESTSLNVVRRSARDAARGTLAVPAATNTTPTSAATSMTPNVVPRWIRSSRGLGTRRKLGAGRATGGRS